MKKFRVIVNGSEYTVEIEELTEGHSPAPVQNTATPAPKPAAPKPATPKATQPQAAADSAPTGGALVAPIPGTVLNIMVSVGDKVTKGQPLLVLEAMKMENEIMATTDGTVKEINVTKDASVNAGDTLIVLSS